MDHPKPVPIGGRYGSTPLSRLRDQKKAAPELEAGAWIGKGRPLILTSCGGTCFGISLGSGNKLRRAGDLDLNTFALGKHSGRLGVDHKGSDIQLLAEVMAFKRLSLKPCSAVPSRVKAEE